MNKLLLTSTAIMAALIVMPAFADDMEQLKAQMKSMQGEMSKLKKKIAKSEAEAEMAEAKAAEARTKPVGGAGGEVKIKMVPAPKFETADGNYSFKVGGILQVDNFYSADDQSDHPDGTNLRRARLNASGVIAKDFSYKFEVEFAGDATAVTDAFIKYSGVKPVALTVGNMKEPFGMENTGSDPFITFIETSSPASTFPTSANRRIGAMLEANGKDETLGAWYAAAGVFGGAVSTVTSTDDESHDYAGRLVWAPIAEKTKVLHLGASALHRVPAAGTTTFTFSTRPENNATNSTTLERAISSAITSYESDTAYGLELAGSYDAFGFQSEYMVDSVERTSGAEPTYHGWYVEGSYFLTGEQRSYDATNGHFGAVKPKDPMTSKGGYGAWGIMARYSDTDLNDAGVNGGQMKNYTFGVKWIPNDYIAVMANYVKVNTDSLAVVADDDPNLFLLRAQVVF